MKSIGFDRFDFWQKYRDVCKRWRSKLMRSRFIDVTDSELFSGNSDASLLLISLNFS